MLPPEQAESITYNGVTTNRYQSFNDYADYNLYVTQEMIDAAKAEVAGMSDLKPCNLIFIEDRVTAPLATYDGHADGELRELNAYAPVTAFGQVGTTGQYTTFGADCSSYTYNVNARGHVTMSGTGAVGFKLYDASGNLCALFNTYSFSLPAGTYTDSGLASGYTLKAAGGNGTDVVATRDNDLEVNEDVKDVTLITDNASDAVVAGAQITAEESLEEGAAYLMYYVGNKESAYMKDTGSAYTGSNDPNPTKNAVYRFTAGTTDGTWNVQNYITGNYWVVPPSKNGTAYAGSATPGNWSMNFLSGGNVAPSSLDSGGSIAHSWNRSGTNLHPWSSGTANVNQLQIYAVAPASLPLDEFTGKNIDVSSSAADVLETGQWYVMYNRGTNRGYVYENATSHILYNTSTAPDGYAPEQAQYLVRLVGENDEYYLQTGYGNFVGKIASNTAVPTTALKEERITFRKISFNDAHYYLTSSDGVVLDANDYLSGDNTVVGYGSAVPTAIGGNNDWAFYPVSLPENYSLCILPSAASVIQGNQTTGKGNTQQALLRVALTPFRACRLTQVNIALTGVEQLENIAVYTTGVDEIQAAGASPVKISGNIKPAETLNIPVTMDDMEAGETLYLWITGDIKSTATEWETVDAVITSVVYTNDYLEEHEMERTTLDLSAIGNPEGAMRIYQSQAFLWTSSKSTPKYYRIPALLKTGTNTLLAFTDDRYTSHADLGSHKIDVLVKKSTDGGLTWGDAITVAAGDGKSDAGYGYGDAAVAQAANGDIVCFMAAGKTSFPSGMLHIGFTKSTDGGATWSAPVDIYDNISYLTNPHATGTTTPFNSTFVSSGHGITQSIAHPGRIAFPALGRINPGSGNVVNEYVMYSDDNGATWTFTDNYGYTGADESKLEEMNDGNLLMSIRMGGFNSSNVARGYNRTTDTDVETWGSQGTWSDLTANGCNSDLLYYTRSTDGGLDVLLHSVVKSYSNGHRKDLRLYMSFDQGATWQEAFQLQPGWAAYSSMQVLDNGDLAILFEDGSIGNEDESDCYAINYVTISSLLMDAKIEELQTVAEDADWERGDVRIIYGKTAETSYGSWSSLTWTSNASSGLAGVTLSASGGSRDKYTTARSNYEIAYHIATANTAETLTLTAPTGYVITGYALQAVNGGSEAYTYTLTATDGTSITTTTNNNSTYKDFVVSGLNSASTTITVNGTSTKWLAIANFVVHLAKTGITETKVKVTNSDAASYGTVTSNVWTSNESSRMEGFTVRAEGLTLSTNVNTWTVNYTVLRASVNAGNGNTGILTLEAPLGYLITGYQLEAVNWSSSNSFTIEPVNGTGGNVTVTSSAPASPSSLEVTDVNSNIAQLRITANTQTNPICFTKLIVTLVNTLREAVSYTYNLVDNEGNIAWTQASVNAHVGYVPVLPSDVKRAFCTYPEVFYKDAACTLPVTTLHNTTKTVYSRFVYDGPFEFSTEDSPKWYLMYSRNDDDASTNYFAYKSEAAFNTATNDNTPSLYDDSEYHWAFIGNPYNVKVKNRNGGYLSAATLTAASGNGYAVSSKITDSDVEFPYNTFSLYGFNHSKITNSTTPFALALNESNNKTWVDGSNRHRLLYHNDITVNEALQISNWSTANWETVEVLEAYPLTLSPINGKSYATLYLPFGVTLPDDVTAYKIAVNGEWARPTAMGQELPAETAALLVSESAVKECVATVNGDAAADAGGNALQGVLTDTSGADLNGYVLNIVDNQLGFYRLSNSGTLAAYHAYLSASAGSVKGFVLNWDELAVGIGSIDNDNENEKVIYNLAGQRISKLQKGVNIVGGKKVLVK